MQNFMEEALVVMSPKLIESEIQLSQSSEPIDDAASLDRRR